MQRTSTSPHPLPCVVQLGFAGSRRLFADPPADPQRRAELERKVEQHLSECLGRLRATLNLQQNHFLVGVSQIARGADTLFTRACLHMEPQPIPQRIVLPQHRAPYFSAVDSEGEPDFTADERAEAEALLNAKHIIQEIVFSGSADRSAQFVDTNAEILRVSDVLVCLLRQDSSGGIGGTSELLERAKQRGTPVLEIRVGLASGEPVFVECWHNLDAEHPFHLPHLPQELAHESVRMAIEPLPTREEFCAPLSSLVSIQASWHQKLFKVSAVVIITTHILATICATLALSLALHHHGTQHGPLDEPFSISQPGPIPILLAVESLLLVVGFAVHRHLHHSQAARLWAVARVVAELARSLNAIGSHHIYLKHLFRLPLPHRFRFLLRTLSVLHLRSTWLNRLADWKPQRDAYIENRVDDQILFYKERLAEDQRRLRLCQGTFTVCSLLAIMATSTELILHVQSHPHGNGLGWSGTLEIVLPVLAIVLPVLAVGGLSWAATLDSEARVETFSETLEFLERQRAFLHQAASPAEFDRLLLETEKNLLGETANWFSRRSNIGVA